MPKHPNQNPGKHLFPPKTDAIARERHSAAVQRGLKSTEQREAHAKIEGGNAEIAAYMRRVPLRKY